MFGASMALAWLEHLETRFGDFYRPSPLLRDLAAGRLTLKELSLTGDKSEAA